MRRLVVVIFLIVVASVVQPTVCRAEGDAGWFDAMEGSSEAAEDSGKSFSDRLVFAPVPMVNPTLDSSVWGCTCILKTMSGMMKKVKTTPPAIP